MKAVVLAAGEGQRLRPLTLTRPKHMISVGGRPLLEYPLVALGEAGIKEVLLIVKYKAEKIKEHLGDGAKFGLKIEYALQKGLRGTADAVNTAKNYVDDDFLVLSGDHLLTPNVIRSVISLHGREKPAATLAAVHVEQPEHFGIFTLDRDRVVKIIEKPPPEVAAGNLANAAVYVFSPEIFDAIRQTGTSLRGELEITDSIRLLIEDGKTVLAAKISSEEWMDIGKPWDLLDANRRVLMRVKREILGSVEENVHLEGSVFVGESTRIRSGSYIEGPAYIGEGSDIGPNCYIRPYTSIGRHVRVGNACEVKNSIILDRVHIAHLSYIGDSIIGEGCNLGAGFISANIRFDSAPVKMRIKEDVVDSGKRKIGVIVGDDARTGLGVLSMPGVKIGCNSWIGPNIVVHRDVPPDTIMVLKQQLEERRR